MTGESGPEGDGVPARTQQTVRVLLLIKGLGPGGAEQLLVNQAAAAAPDIAYEAAYLLPWKDHLVAALRASGVAVTCLDGPREWDLRWAVRLRGLLRRRPIDVVHAHSPYVAAVTRLLLRTLPRRDRPAMLYTEHNRWPRHQPLTRALNRLTFGLDDADIAVSDDVRDTIPPRLRRRVRTMVHGIDIAAVAAQAERRDEVRAELGLADDDVVVGAVANFRREKNYPAMLEAARLAMARQERLRFVSVGQGPLEDELRAQHRTLGLGDRFLLLGYRDDATRVMSAFDVFTLSSTHEGLPVSLMDALALGLPGVMTAVGGIPEVVTDGVEARLVPAGDTEALADAYVELADDDERRHAMGLAARKAAAQFDGRQAAAELEALYRQLAAHRRRR